MDKWQACGEQFDGESLVGQDCYAGLDLASTQDIAAFVLMFTAADGVKRLLPFFWSPEGANKLRERMNKPRIDHWVKQGFIKQVPGDEIDFGIVRDDIYEICQKYGVKKIAKDRWNSAQIGHELTACGLDVFDCPQGKWLSPSAKEFYRLVNTKELRHNENPVLSWMAGNVTAIVDAAENVVLSKGKSTDKIDGIVSAVMCVALHLAEPAAEGIQEPIWLS
jgi:phage terminase large subunit-like protein